MGDKGERFLEIKRDSVRLLKIRLADQKENVHGEENGVGIVWSQIWVAMVGSGSYV